MLCPLTLLLLTAAPYHFDPAVAEECRVRDGLPNLLAKLNAGVTVKIAYLGGSITAANGWRPRTLAWFKQQWPSANVEEINAAISGTGSDYSACRVQGDVLSKQPDLVFLECRVNGGGGYEKQSVEGLVRQIWQANPTCDICFVYTIGTWMLKDLQAGKSPGFSQVMETIANASGIPTIDLGIEVAQQVAADKLVYQAAEDIPGKVVFSRDGVHPGDAGHDIYRDVIARSIRGMKGVGTVGNHVLPAKLAPNCWDVACLVPIEQVSKSAGWVPVDLANDPVYTDDRGRTAAMLRGAMKCDQVGGTLTVKWHGTTVGLSDIPYGEPYLIEAVIDGGTPLVVERKQREMRRQHSRFWYLPAQPEGDHTVVFTLRTLPAGQSWYAGQVLIVGTRR